MVFWHSKILIKFHFFISQFFVQSPVIAFWFSASETLVNPHTYLLTPWCRVLLEKLTGLQLVKKFPGFHGTRRFITALTSVRHLSLSWATTYASFYHSGQHIYLLYLTSVLLLLSFGKRKVAAYLMEIIAVLLSRAVPESDWTRRAVWAQTNLTERRWNGDGTETWRIVWIGPNPGHAVAQLVEAPHCKSESRGSDPDHVIIINIIFPAALGPRQ